jgi:hypothetical protein
MADGGDDVQAMGSAASLQAMDGTIKLIECIATSPIFSISISKISRRSNLSHISSRKDLRSYSSICWNVSELMRLMFM